MRKSKLDTELGRALRDRNEAQGQVKAILSFIEGDCRFCRLVLVEGRSPNCIGCVQQNKKFWEAPWGKSKNPAQTKPI